MAESTRALEQFSFLFAQDGGYLRIPIWGHIPLSRAARRIIEHPDFVRLSKIRQLGFVYYVFPGASHTRFEHSVGTYRLSVLILQRLALNPINWYDPATPKISREDAHLFLAASLLHDIGHYPLAHVVDRLGGNSKSEIRSIEAFQCHEDRARSYILADRSPGSIYSILKDDWGIGEPEMVADVISRPQDSGLPGKMLSGILDPDKMDYLMRDARACGVPYGNIDTDRLIESLVLDVDGPRTRLGITEKGIAPLESLVFAKYMMFRHIYWHHAVRIAVAMFTRFVQDGLDAEAVDPSSFYRLPDDALIEELAGTADRIPSGELIIRLKNRALYKRGITFYPEHAAGETEFAVSREELERIKELYWHPDRRREKEVAICELLGREEGIRLSGFEVLLDIPRAVTVFDVDDFRELHVLTASQTGTGSRFVPFDSYGFTQLTADFAQEFERFSRRVQVTCRPDLRDAVTAHWREIKAIVVS
ncbi:MAG TPA: HD domain-containing protein [Armatimonadota bacterium]|nr:HD domain-containing protein [Armatimonadota bacterium]